MQDSTLERYLEAAKLVADHAVIGSGPLEFFADPGKTGRELSAIARIQAIYREHGFRTAAGEGAEPFGLDRYPRAMLVAWQYRFRDELGLGHGDAAGACPARGPERPALRARVGRPRQSRLALPAFRDRRAWRSLPPPGELTAADARTRCDELCDVLRSWQSTLAGNAGDEEEAAVLTAGEVQVAATHTLTASIRWPAGAKVAAFELSVSRASKHPADAAVVVWRNPRLRFRRGEQLEAAQPLSTFLTPESARRLAFGKHPRGGRSAISTS